MITLKNISKSYSGGCVLDNISITIPEKSITGIIGPNGAGKSTLIKIIAGFEFAGSGSVLINNRQSDYFNQIKDQIYYMPEQMSLYPDYFVDRFLEFYHGAMQYRDDELSDLLSLKNIFDKKISQLSKGWHQRLKLYTALCNKKKIVILDEPFEGFDPLQMKQIVNIIRSRNNKDQEFILSIHQLSYARKNGAKPLSRHS